MSQRRPLWLFLQHRVAGMYLPPLILAMRATPTREQREVSIGSFQLAYQLLEQFFKSLDRQSKHLEPALNSVVSIASVSHCPTIDAQIQTPNQNRTVRWT